MNETARWMVQEHCYPGMMALDNGRSAVAADEAEARALAEAWIRERVPGAAVTWEESAPVSATATGGECKVTIDLIGAEGMPALFTAEEMDAMRRRFGDL